MGRALRALVWYCAMLVPVTLGVATTVWVLAGPHTAWLPSRFHPLVLGLGWITVIALPPWVAWRRVTRRP
jgi:hypothetical protein